MVNVVESVTVRTDSVTLWREIGWFGSVADGHPMLESMPPSWVSSSIGTTFAPAP
jgi:hypothetical protein